MRMLSLLLLATLPLIGATQPEGPIRRPEIRKDDSWTYRSHHLVVPDATVEQTVRVTFSNDKTILAFTTLKGEDRELDTTFTAEWNPVTTHAGFIYRPHAGLLRFPLQIGEKRDVSYELIRPRETTAESVVQATVTVHGWESVTVPAGTFRAVRVEQTGRVQRADGSRPFPRTITVWYSPEVRRWVKFEVVTPKVRAGEELIGFKLNED